MGTLILALGVVLVAATGVLAASCLRLRSAVSFLLAVYILASAEVVLVSLGLSTSHRLTRPALVASFVLLLLLAFAAWARVGRAAPPLSGVVHATRDALRDRAVATLAVVVVALHLYLLAVALSVPQSLPDTMLYHLPRAALWKQQHAVAHVPNVPTEVVNVFPPVAEIEVMSSMILAEGDRYVALTQLLALVGACIAIAGIGRRLELSRRAVAFGALSFATFTVVALQAPTALNDLVVASLLVVCAYFALGNSRTELALSALALALAVATKGTVAFALPVLALFVLASQPRSRLPGLLAFGAGGLALGSFWFVVNLFETGAPTGGVGVDQGGAPFIEDLWLSLRDLLELSDAENTGYVASPYWGVAALAVGGAFAGFLASRGRRRVGVTALAAGAIAFLAAPLVVTWAGVADRTFAHVRAAVGLGDSPAERLPAGFNESAMHSSYGLAFVVLFIGAGVLVVSDIIRRKLPLAAAIALAGVPLSLVFTALVLGSDPQRMRYVAFSVALAATVFGVALRVRVLAWSAIVLAAVTSVISIGYFVPRPASLALLPGNRSTDRPRWFVQAEGGAGDPQGFRFLAERVPPDATVALSLARNAYLYPAWDAGLRRTVLFVPEGGPVPESASWLVVDGSSMLDQHALEKAGWRLELASPRGWRIFGR